MLLARSVSADCYTDTAPVVNLTTQPVVGKRQDVCKELTVGRGGIRAIVEALQTHPSSSTLQVLSSNRIASQYYRGQSVTRRTDAVFRSMGSGLYEIFASGIPIIR